MNLSRSLFKNVVRPGTGLIGVIWFCFTRLWRLDLPIFKYSCASVNVKRGLFIHSVGGVVSI